MEDEDIEDEDDEEEDDDDVGNDSKDGNNKGPTKTVKFLFFIFIFCCVSLVF